MAAAIVRGMAAAVDLAEGVADSRAAEAVAEEEEPVGVGNHKIVSAIRAAETATSGEIRVHLSHSKNEADVFEAARGQFEALEMHRTQDRNAILLYMNLKLHRFAIFGDEGIHQKVGQGFWDQLSQQVSTAIKNQDVTAGIVLAVSLIGDALKQHFPYASDDKDELDNEVTES